MAAPWEPQSGTLSNSGSGKFKKPMHYEPELAAGTLDKARESFKKRDNMLAALGLADEEGIDVEDSEELEEDSLNSKGKLAASPFGTAVQDGAGYIKAVASQEPVMRMDSRASVSTLTLEVQKLTQENRELRAQVAAGGSNQQTQTVLAQYEDDIRQLQTRIQSLEHTGKENEATIQQLQGQLQQTMVEMTTQLQDAQTRLALQTGEQSTQLQQLQSELQTTRQKLANTTAQLDKAMRDRGSNCGSTASSSRASGKDMQAQAQANADDARRIKELQGLNQALEDGKWRLAIQVSELQQQRRALEQAKNQQIGELQKQFIELQCKYVEQEQQLQQQNLPTARPEKESHEAIKDQEISTLQKQLAELQQKYEQQEQLQQRTLSPSLSEKRLQEQAKNQEISDLQKQLSDLQEKYEQQQQQLQQRALSRAASEKQKALPSAATVPAQSPVMPLPQLRSVSVSQSSSGSHQAAAAAAVQQEALQAALAMKETRLAEALEEIADLRREGKRSTQEEVRDLQRQTSERTQAAQAERDQALARASDLQTQLSELQQEVSSKEATWKAEMEKLAGDKDAQHAAALQSALWTAQEQHTQRMTEVEAELKLLRQQLQQSKVDLAKQAESTSGRLKQASQAALAGLAPKLQSMTEQLSAMQAFKTGVLEDLLAVKNDMFNEKVMTQMLRLVRDKEIAIRQKADEDAQAAIATAEQRARDATESAQDDKERLEQQLRVQKLELEGQIRLHQTKWAAEFEKRKKLHNLVLELRGNIRVLCRVRPLLPKESIAAPEGPAPVKVLSQEGVRVATDKGDREFEFDRVFNAEDGQDTVFGEVEGLVTSVLDGYHVSIMAYGQTGSGKTHTMEGPENDPGVNARALTQLFRLAEERTADWSYSFRAGVLEIYNEQIYDLLGGGKDQDVDKLDVKQGPEGMYVPGLTLEEVSSTTDVSTVISRGKANRSTFSTNMNEHSSRSHLVLIVYVTATNKSPQPGGTNVLRGKLHLVDLAGSERVGRTGAQGDRLKEAQAINKSLSALGDVISALQQRAPHIPYRNSKLTRLLEDSLGANSRCVMVVNVSPAAENAPETKCSLEFASRARKVELGKARQSIDAEPRSPTTAVPTAGSASTPNSGANTPVRERVAASATGRNSPMDPMSRVALRNNVRAAGRTATTNGAV